MTRCPRCAEDNPQHARFCLACGLSLEPAAAEPAAEERRLVTAVFVDLVGSTALADQADPEDVRARLLPYYSGLRTELERFGGTVEKFIGDAVVALFGAPIANEDDPERALRAAFSVRLAIGELNAADAWLRLSVRTGIATGEALVRRQAGLAVGETLVLGDVMNMAARIQAAAPPGAILVCRRTHDATQHAVDYRPVDQLSAQGKLEPVQVWEALGLKEAIARRHSESPFIGRQRELAVLDHQWRRVRDERRPATALVLAAPGTGKTRLFAAFAERVGADIFWGRCLAYGEAGAYAPVAELLVASGADRLPADAAPGTDGQRTISAALNAVLGSSAGGSGAADEITQGELRWGIRRAFELTAATPIVLVFEDLHWADPALIELIRFVEEASAPILILGSARPDLGDREPSLCIGSQRRVVMTLHPLTTAESETLVTELLGPVAATAELAPVVRAAEGNPLFIEETVHMLADRGLLASGATVGPLPVPPSLRSMIGARLDRLPEREKHLALRAAVVGSSFWPGAVASLNGIVADVEGAFEALIDLDVAEERDASTVRGEREFAFKHELIREVAYARLPKGLRAELHVRCAEWISARQERDEFAEISAHHLEQACRLAREIERSPVPPPLVAAAEALRAAAEKAERREGLLEADRLYVRALDLLADEHPGTAVELRLRRGRVLAALGRLDEACEWFLAVAAEAASLGRDDLRGAALVGYGNTLQKQGRGEEARVCLEEAREIAGRAGDTRLEVQALFELAELNRDFSGAIAIAVEEVGHALELAAGLGDRALLAEGELRMGFALCAGGELESAERALARSAEIGSELGGRRDESRATFLRAFTAYHRGRPEEAERLALDAQEWFERTGDSYFRIQNLRALSTYALARADPVEAERRLREALALAGPSGGWLVSDLNAALAELLAGTGRLGEAEAAAQAARAHVPEEDPAARAIAYVASACVAAASGDGETVRRWAAEAVGLLVELGNALELARGRITVARALAAVGESEQASGHLRLAGEECTRMGATMLLAEAEVALSALEVA